MLFLPEVASEFKQTCGNVVMSNEGGKYGIPFWAICQTVKICHFEALFNTGPYGAGNFKMLLMQF